MEILSFRPTFLLPKFISAARYFFGRKTTAGGVGSFSGRIWVHDPLIIIPFSRVAYRGIFGISLPKKTPAQKNRLALRYRLRATFRAMQPFGSSPDGAAQIFTLENSRGLRADITN